MNCFFICCNAVGVGRGGGGLEGRVVCVCLAVLWAGVNEPRHLVLLVLLRLRWRDVFGWCFGHLRPRLSHGRRRSRRTHGFSSPRRQSLLRPQRLDEVHRRNRRRARRLRRKLGRRTRVQRHQRLRSAALAVGIRQPLVEHRPVALRDLLAEVEHAVPRVALDGVRVRPAGAPRQLRHVHQRVRLQLDAQLLQRRHLLRRDVAAGQTLHVEQHGSLHVPGCHQRPLRVDQALLAVARQHGHQERGALREGQRLRLREADARPALAVLVRRTHAEHHTPQQPVRTPVHGPQLETRQVEPLLQRRGVRDLREPLLQRCEVGHLDKRVDARVELRRARQRHHLALHRDVERRGVVRQRAHVGRHPHALPVVLPLLQVGPLLPVFVEEDAAADRLVVAEHTEVARAARQTPLARDEAAVDVRPDALAAVRRQRVRALPVLHTGLPLTGVRVARRVRVPPVAHTLVVAPRAVVAPAVLVGHATGPVALVVAPLADVHLARLHPPVAPDPVPLVVLVLAHVRVPVHVQRLAQPRLRVVRGVPHPLVHAELAHTPDLELVDALVLPEVRLHQLVQQRRWLLVRIFLLRLRLPRRDRLRPLLLLLLALPPLLHELVVDSHLLLRVAEDEGGPLRLLQQPLHQDELLLQHRPHQEALPGAGVQLCKLLCELVVLLLVQVLCDLADEGPGPGCAVGARRVHVLPQLWELDSLLVSLSLHVLLRIAHCVGGRVCVGRVCVCGGRRLWDGQTNEVQIL
eukprot:Rhum_TRINITY_DN16573_c0_g1::Rhum_TRINITY_DN16573_c0_g1_i1::g.163691::m.163691